MPFKTILLISSNTIKPRGIVTKQIPRYPIVLDIALSSLALVNLRLYADVDFSSTVRFCAISSASSSALIDEVEVGVTVVVGTILEQNDATVRVETVDEQTHGELTQFADSLMVEISTRHDGVGKIVSVSVAGGQDGNIDNVSTAVGQEGDGNIVNVSVAGEHERVGNMVSVSVAQSTV